MNLFKKITLRIFRILIWKKGIYGKIGTGNKFTRGVFMEEASTIGNFNYLGPYSMINHAIIQNYCSIGPGVKIGQGVHSKDYITTYQPLSHSLTGYSLKTSPAKIGSDVWCGANVVIMQGVKIGNGAIIGANAVVTSDIPEYAIAVGIPARVIKYRFDSHTIKAINDSQWFESDLETSKEKIKQLEKLIKVNIASSKT